MGVTDTTFQNYLYGKTSPPVDKVELLAQKFGYPPKWFFQEDAEITMPEIREAVTHVERALGKNPMDVDKKAMAIAVVARHLAREKELGAQGDFDRRLKKFVDDTLDLFL